VKRSVAKNASATRVHVIEALEPRQLLSAGGFLDPTFQQGGFKILSGLNDSVVTLSDGKILTEATSPFTLKRLDPLARPISRSASREFVNLLRWFNWAGEGSSFSRMASFWPARS